MVGVVDLGADLAYAPLVQDGEHMTEQGACKPTPPVSREYGDQPEPRGSRVVPDARQPDAVAACLLEFDQIGSRVEVSRIDEAPRVGTDEPLQTSQIAFYGGSRAN